jgi:pyrimidine operon attenuation protein/uracil phosphoribosyltransferase
VQSPASSLAPAAPPSAQSPALRAAQTLPPAEIHAAIDRLAAAISARHPPRKTAPPAPPLPLLGIANGGITLASRLAERLPGAHPGVLDISFHRDDIGRHPIPKEFAPTHIPADVNNATIILIDDVIQSGRTINAALNEIFDHGRPARVELAVLIDRGGRLLPIAPDYTALALAVPGAEKLILRLDPARPARDSLEIKTT